MKKLHALAAIAMLIGFTAMTLSGNRDHSGTASIRDRLVGAWQLESLEEPLADGTIHRADCTGMLVFTPDGHMSVQVMYRTVPNEDKAAPVQYAQGGYEASFGRYEIEDARAFTFHVEGALVRTLIGKDLRRTYELSGNQLVVKSPDPNEHWRVVWKHY